MIRLIEFAVEKWFEGDTGPWENLGPLNRHLFLLQGLGSFNIIKLLYTLTISSFIHDTVHYYSQCFFLFRFLMPQEFWRFVSFFLWEKKYQLYSSSIHGTGYNQSRTFITHDQSDWRIKVLTTGKVMVRVGQRVEHRGNKETRRYQEKFES